MCSSHPFTQGKVAFPITLFMLQCSQSKLPQLLFAVRFQHKVFNVAIQELIQSTLQSDFICTLTPSTGQRGFHRALHMPLQPLSTYTVPSTCNALSCVDSQLFKVYLSSANCLKRCNVLINPLLLVFFFFLTYVLCNLGTLFIVLPAPWVSEFSNTHLSTWGTSSVISWSLKCTAFLKCNSFVIN